jgi:DNA-binding GntR family transcriptional regulator
VTSNVSPVVSVTRRDAVLSELRGAILSGRLKPGDRIREVSMSKELGVSRPTLREALYQLIHEGLLIQEVYKGITVASMDAAAIEDIAVVRVQLETIAAEAIARDRNDAGRIALMRAWEAYDAAAAAGNPALETETHLELHRTIWMESGNTMLYRLWPIVAPSINLALTTDQATRADVERGRRMHRELVDVIVKGPRRSIKATVREHIMTSACELVEMLRQQETLTLPS